MPRTVTPCGQLILVYRPHSVYRYKANVYGSSKPS
jgi:hypothetical protein